MLRDILLCLHEYSCLYVQVNTSGKELLSRLWIRKVLKKKKKKK